MICCHPECSKTVTVLVVAFLKQKKKAKFNVCSKHVKWAQQQKIKLEKRMTAEQQAEFLSENVATPPEPEDTFPQVYPVTDEHKITEVEEKREESSFHDVVFVVNSKDLPRKVKKDESLQAVFVELLDKSVHKSLDYKTKGNLSVDIEISDTESCMFLGEEKLDKNSKLWLRILNRAKRELREVG